MLLAAAQEASTGIDWSTILTSVLPAAAAVVAAVIAGRAAVVARRAEADAERVRRLEERIAGRKYEVYQPILAALNQTLLQGKDGIRPPKNLTVTLGDFATWIAVFGADDAVRAYRNFMQATFHNAPAPVLLRLYADFQLAARRDMGDPTTTLACVDLLGMRLTDLHTGDPTVYEGLTLPFEEVCRRAGWVIPWEQTPSASTTAPAPVPKEP